MYQKLGYCIDMDFHVTSSLLCRDHSTSEDTLWPKFYSLVCLA